MRLNFSNSTNWVFVSIFILLGNVACQQTTLTFTPTPKELQEIKLVKETRLTDDGWSFVQWSPTGTRLLLTRPINTAAGTVTKGPLAVVNLPEGSLQKLSLRGISALWAPDGQAVLVKSLEEEGQEGQFWLYSLLEEKSVLVKGLTGAPIAWLADGQLIYDTGDSLRSAKINLPPEDSNAAPLSITEQVVLLRYDGHDFRRGSVPAPHLEAIMLYDGNNDQDRRWWLVQPDGERVEIDHPLYSIGSCCAWSPDGLDFAFFSAYPSEKGLYLVNHTGTYLRQVIAATAIGEGTFISMDFSPDGQKIAFEWAKMDEGFPFDNTQIYVINTDGSSLTHLTPNSAPHQWLHWSPAGSYIAYLDKEDRVWVAKLEGF
jgi:dipeptidyl aminopeptidase/acylaminoacyl peptidase